MSASTSKPAESDIHHPDWHKVLHTLQNYSTVPDENVKNQTDSAADELVALISKFITEAGKCNTAPLPSTLDSVIFKEAFSSYLLADYSSRKKLAQVLTIICNSFQDAETEHHTTMVSDNSGAVSALFMTLVEIFAKSISKSAEAGNAIVDSIKTLLPATADWNRVYTKAHLYNATQSTYCINLRAHGADVVVKAAGNSLLSNKPLCINCLEVEHQTFQNLASVAQSVEELTK